MQDGTVVACVVKAYRSRQVFLMFFAKGAVWQDLFIVKLFCPCEQYLPPERERYKRS